MKRAKRSRTSAAWNRWRGRRWPRTDFLAIASGARTAIDFAQCASTIGASILRRMRARIYTDRDADLKFLRGKTCAVIGYGAQGRAHALNLKDSGMRILVGLPSRSKSRCIARKQGLKVVS